MILIHSSLKEYSCFSGVSSSSTSKTTSALNWAKLAPKIEKYNAVLAKALPSGTGEIIKGIFKLSNAYTKQVQTGGTMGITEAAEEKKGGFETETTTAKRKPQGRKKCVPRKGLGRVRAVSETTEKRSKTVLNIIEVGTESAVRPISSHAGEQILATVPGKVLLDSLGSFSRLMDAAEVAQNQALSTSSKAATKMVSKRFGESGGRQQKMYLPLQGMLQALLSTS